MARDREVLIVNWASSKIFVLIMLLIQMGSYLQVGTTVSSNILSVNDCRRFLKYYMCLRLDSLWNFNI